MSAASACPSCSARVGGDRCPSCGAAVRAGSYRIVSVLAQTAHGRTYRAEGPEGLVALKELVFALVPSAQQLDAFEREAKLLAAVSHPQVPRMIESFREGEGPALRLYLAQELVDGEPLSARLGIGEPEARDVARQMLRVLGHLHERGIVHRDVKPSNILRRADGTLALVDFGAARVLEGATYDATVVGTFGYMPPEQLGGTVDATSDLYALGATLAHLVGRKAPEDLLGPDLELQLDHLDVTPGFRAFLRKLTERRRASRPRSAAEALKLLEAPAAPRRQPIRAAVVVAMVLGLAAGAWLLAESAASSASRDAAERARRAQIEAIEHEASAPPKAPPAHPSAADHRDVSIGRLLSGEKLREIDPDLPPCYARAGIELARLRLWPAQGALQLKLVLHSQHSACDWTALNVAAAAPHGKTLHARGAHGDAPHEGWREAFFDFDLPDGVASVRVDLSGPTRPIESWRVDLDGRTTKRVGYAIAGTAEASAVQVPTESGCAMLRHGTVDRVWLDAERRELRLHATFAKRTDAPGSCQRPTRAVLLDGRAASTSSAALDSDRAATFSVSLPAGRDRLRVALGDPRRPAAVLRIDLRSAIAEREALAATQP